MSGEHGIMRPNPALLHDLEERREKKSKPVIAHQLGAGAECTVCGPKCPGFQLHFWRKHCSNCRCGKADHNVYLEDNSTDVGFFFVGKIFDRPLRSKQEVMEFCYSNSLDDSDHDSEDERSTSFIDRVTSETTGGGDGGRRVKFDWIPQNVPKTLAKKYMKQLPESQVPIAGSQGARERQQRLEKQFPLHDIEPSQCDVLPPEELESMMDYIGHVKKDVAGLGTVYELPNGRLSPLPGSPRLTRLEDLPPPPPELLLNNEPIYANIPINPANGLTRRGSHSGPPSPVFHARPYQDNSGSHNGSPSSSPNRTPTSRRRSSLNTGLPAGSGMGLAGRFQAPSPSPPPMPRALEETSFPVTASGGASSDFSTLQHHSVRRCEGCGEELGSGDVAVRAERAGANKVWHPQCFKCFKCKELLADLLYYHKSGHVYCARDYASLINIPRCAACDELIFASEYTGAENRVWHLRHFCCYECDKPLAGHKYIPGDNGHPLCLMCFQAKHGKVCDACGEYISPEEKRLSLAMSKGMVSPTLAPSLRDGDTVLVHWHASPSCFRCRVCHKSLIDSRMTIKHGSLLCSSKCLGEITQGVQV